MSAVEPAAGRPAAGARSGLAADPLGWGLAVTPLLPVAIGLPFAVAGVMPPFSAGQFLALLAAAGLVVADKRRAAAADPALASRLPSVWWALLPPVYLWRRATALGRGRAQAWAWAACIPLTFVLGIAVAGVAATRGAGASALPACDDRGIAQDVVAIFTDVPTVRQAGVRGVRLSRQREVAPGPGRTPQERLCAGSVLTSAGQEVPVTYALERQGPDVVIDLELE